jgi:hypothetical protein
MRGSLAGSPIKRGKGSPSKGEFYGNEAKVVKKEFMALFGISHVVKPG